MRYLFITVLFFLVSCGSRHQVNTTNGIKLKNTNAKRIARQLKKGTDQINNWSAKASLKYQDGIQNLNLRAGIILKKDKLIGITIYFFGLTVAKVKITPNSLEYYEKRGGTYYQGSIDKIRQISGMPIDFHFFQNLLMAQPVFPFSQKPKLSVEVDIYKVMDHNESGVFETFFSHLFLLVQQTFKTHIAPHKVTIFYDDYRPVGQIQLKFPYQIKAKVSDKNLGFELRFHKIKINQQSMSFSYKVPDHFKRID